MWLYIEYFYIEKLMFWVNVKLKPSRLVGRKIKSFAKESAAVHSVLVRLKAFIRHQIHNINIFILELRVSTATQKSVKQNQ